MSKRVTTPLTLGGQSSVGNAASIPDGYVRALNNHLTRPNRLPARPPFVYDSLMSINGLANFDDTTNKVTRLLAINTSRQVFEKSATAGVETWGGANATTISGTRLTDAANYRGITYAMFDDGAEIPNGAASFDGTNISTSPFTSAIQSRTITTFDERLYLAYPRVTVTPQFFNNNPIGRAYDLTDGTHWPMTNITATNVAALGGTACRLLPTSTTAASFKYSSATFGGTVGGIARILATKNDVVVMWRSDMRCGSATYQMPVTLEIVLNTDWQSGTFAVGDSISDGTYVQRVTVGGASGGAAPAWNAALGGATVDGAVTWINEGSAIIGSLETELDTASADGAFQTLWVRAVVKASTNTNSVTVRCKFFNTANPTITLAPVDVSFKDGLADGDPRKANKGQQVTIGDFYFPFVNTETANSAAVDMEEVVWSEIGDPKTIRASNTFKLRESVGRPTAATALGGRLLVTKRNAIWQFQDTGDPDVPIRREKFMAGIGIVGPRAHDKFEDEWFFIGENDCYRYRVSDSLPKPFCGDGMRETIMSKSASSWVESQSTYKRPLLAIDQSQLIVWVYTQKGKLFAYDLRSERWSTHYVSNNAEVDAMIWNANTGNMYVSFGGYGLTRMSYTTTANDTIDNTATTYPGDISVVFRPIELRDPGRYDAFCESVQILYATSIAQSGQTVTVSTSYDQGSTFPNSADYTPVTVSTNGDFVPMTLDVWEGEPSITLKLTRTGKLGEGSWSLATMATAMLKVMRGEFPKVNATPGSSNF